MADPENPGDELNVGLLLFILTFLVLAAARLMLMRLETKAGK